MRSGGVNHIIVQQVALLIQADDLTAGAETRVNSQHAFVAQWRGEQQLTHILGKSINGLVIGFFLGCCGKFGLNRGLDQSLEAVLGSLLDQLRGLAVALDDNARNIVEGAVIIDLDTHLEETFFLATADSKQLVGRNALERSRELIVVLIVAALDFLALDEVGHKPRVILETTPYGVTHRLVLTHPLGNDVLGASNSGIGIRHLVTVNKLASPSLDINAMLRHDYLGERLKAQLPGSLGTRLTLGFIGQIDILEGCGIPAVVDAVGQFGSELVLCLDGLEDGGTALLQFTVIAQPLVNGLDRKFVEVTCCLLAVTADKRDGSAIVKKIDGACHLIDGDIELLGNERRELSCHREN